MIIPPSIGWLCASMKPGMSTVEPRSVTLTPGATAWHWATVPTARSLPVTSSKATASARGLASSIVMMVDALRIIVAMNVLSVARDAD